MGGPTGSLLCRDAEETEKEEQAAAPNAVTEEESQGVRTAPAPKVTAAQGGSLVCRRRFPLGLPSSFPLTGLPPPLLRPPDGQEQPVVFYIFTLLI